MGYMISSITVFQAGMEEDLGKDDEDSRLDSSSESDVEVLGDQPGDHLLHKTVQDHR